MMFIYRMFRIRTAIGWRQLEFYQNHLGRRTGNGIKNSYEEAPIKHYADATCVKGQPKQPTYKKNTKLDKNREHNNSGISQGGEVEFCRVQAGLGDLYVMNSKTNIGKIVKFILDQNIEVSKNNILLSHITPYNLAGRNDHKTLKEEYGFRVGRFTKAEDQIIQQNWTTLTAACGIEQPKLLKKLADKENPARNMISQIKRKNLIGMYLSNGLDRKRHCANVFAHAMKLLCTEKTGAFTPDEDKIIIEAVEKDGNCPTTWKDLCLKLLRNVDTWAVVRTRYTFLLAMPATLHKSWELEEDKTLTEQLFKNFKTCSIETVRSIDVDNLKNIKYINRGQSAIYYHWKRTLQPILLSYHLGTLHSYWRPAFLKYVMEADIEYIKEINWDEALRKFPSETRASLESALTSRAFKQKMLNIALKEYFEGGAKVKHEYTEKQKEYRGKIVSFYLDIFRNN